MADGLLQGRAGVGAVSHGKWLSHYAGRCGSGGALWGAAVVLGTPAPARHALRRGVAGRVCGRGPHGRGGSRGVGNHETPARAP